MRWLLFLVAGCSASSPGALPNGTWSLALTGSKYKSGTVTIAAPQASMTLVLKKEGTEDSPGCTLSTSRVEVTLAVSNGSGTGSSTYVSQKSGAACGSTQLDRSLLSTFQITGSGSGFDKPDGTWDVTGSRPGDVAHLTINGGVFTGTFMNRSGYSFSGNLMEGLAKAMDAWGASLDANRQ